MSLEKSLDSLDARVKQNRLLQFDFKKALPLTIIGAMGGVLVFGFFQMLNPIFRALGILGLLIGLLGGTIVGLLNSRPLQKG